MRSRGMMSPNQPAAKLSVRGLVVTRHLQRLEMLYAASGVMALAR